jgi:hypothetical protein
MQIGNEFFRTVKQASLAGAAYQPDDISVFGTSVHNATEVQLSSTAERHALTLFYGMPRNGLCKGVSFYYCRHSLVS